MHIAQINIGMMVAPTDDPAVAEFMDNLDRINALADEAEGFVWRLQTESGNATDIQIFSNPLELVNMSVWQTVEALKKYVYRSEHLEFFRRRPEWFEPDAKRVALWWVKAGTLPELADAVRRVEFLEQHGPSPYAFGFAKVHAPLVFEVANVDTPETQAFIANSELRPAVDGCEFLWARYDAALVGCAAIPGKGLADQAYRSHANVFIIPDVSDLQIREALVDQLRLAADRSSQAM